MIRQAGRAYSQDLRDRVIAAVDGGMAVRAAAPLFRVSISYIYKALIRRRTNGETRPRAQRNHVPPKLAGHEETLRHAASCALFWPGRKASASVTPPYGRRSISLG